MGYHVKTFTRDNPVTATVNTTATRVFDQNPNRCLLYAANISGNAGYIAPRDEAAATLGIPVANGGTLVLTKRDHYDLVTRAWTAINAVAGGTWYFIEEIEIPEGFEEGAIK